MVEFPFEHNAMKGEPLPKRLDIADSCLYIALKYLYMMYKSGLINRKDAKEEKRRLFYNWTADKAKIEFLNRETEALKNKIAKAAEEYKENPCVDSADKLYAAFYNLPDNWREELKNENQ